MKNLSAPINNGLKKYLTSLRREIVVSLVASATLLSAHAQIQTAGSLFVNVDASSQPQGRLTTLVNSGVLGGLFEARTAAGAAASSTNVLFNGGTGIQFTGSFCMPLVNSPGGALIPPPNGLVGSNATASIEVWVLNPAIADEETLVSWGRRGVVGQNMAFGYGVNASFGAVSHSSTADVSWDPNALGAPVSTNWHHLVYTFNGSTQSVYADGVLMNSKVAGFNIATNSGIALGAQWLFNGTSISTTPALANLTIGKVRIHDGTLTAAQVLNNFNFEKATFIPPITPQFLSALPVHRYSFNETPTNNAVGLTFQDSIGTAHGIVQGTNGAIVPEFARGRLILRGGSPATTAYGDLPNGLLSSNSTNNGGNGQFSIEVWYRNMANVASSRVFDIGAPGIPGSPGVEVTGVGGYPVGGVFLDSLFYSAQVGANVNQRRLSWLNKDPLPAGTVTNSQAISTDVATLNSFQNDRHMVVTWSESARQIVAYENGLKVATILPTNSMAAINDVNVWLGRSVNTDSGFVGEFDEVRFYTNVLTASEILGDFLVGADTLNTSEQNASIITQPEDLSVLQGSSVTFSVNALGSPSVSYQWRRNTTSIPGATDNVLNVVASLENGGDYSCVVSNFANGSSHSVTSENATLTVTPTQGSLAQLLHETRDGNRLNFAGSVGGLFQVGSTDAVVTHLGFYDANNDGLVESHQVAIFSSDVGAPLITVTVPAGTGAFLTNGYRWVALDTPFILRANAGYIIQAEVFNSPSTDPWPDVFIPGNWNPYYVGTNGPATRMGRFIGGAWTGAFPTSSSTQNGLYAAPDLAVLPVGPLKALAFQTNVTQYATTSLTLNGFANGEGIINVQWYKAPSSLLPGQTNISLVIPSLSTGDAGDYYMVASNGSETAQSGNVTVAVLPDASVSITEGPASVNVPNGFPTTFSVTAVGTPTISYQWRLGGVPIVGATDSAYTIPSVNAANNGQVYSVIVSNFALGGLHSATSGNAMLTVQPNVSQPAQVLFSTVDGNRDNFTGSAGGIFQVGANDVLVTHLGFYDFNKDGLNREHRVGLYTTTVGSAPFATVTVPAGTDAYFTNGYRWVALNAPVTLTNNTSYILVGESFASSGDGWPDIAARTWNDYFVGATDPLVRNGRYASAAWPAFPGTTSGTANANFGPANLAVLPIGAPIVGIVNSNITKYVGESAKLTVTVNGEAPTSIQWYKALGTLLNGETNLTLSFSSLSLANAGDYYVIATNPQTFTQSANITLTVLQLTAPIITEQPQPQTQSIYVHQQAIFTVTAIGEQPLSYQWKHNGTDIPDATNGILTVLNASLENAGNYSVTITNSLGATNSQTASLTVQTLPEGSYASAIVEANPAIYYRFSDVFDGTNQTFNLGSLGAGYNGTYEGSIAGAEGPRPPTFPNLDSVNQSVFLDRDGFGVANGDVVIPALNLNTNAGAHCTMAAWVYSASAQAPYSGIIFNRGVSGANGIGIKTNASSIDVLEYHWNNTYYTFDTGLAVPVGEWVFVALVIEPTRATLYLYQNGTVQKATNVAAHAAVPFSDPTYIGWDSTAATARRFYGAIDEAMIFGRSLSAAELDAIYSASIAPTIEINARISAGKLILTWPTGILQRAINVGGPYIDDNTAVSPYTNAPSGSEFYRVRIP